MKQSLLGTLLVLVMGAAGCQPSMLDQCREAVKLGSFHKDMGCDKGFPEWGANDYCNGQVLECLGGLRR